MPLFCLGSNVMGQLGLETTIFSTNKPMQHPFFIGKDVLMIAAGKLHALVLCEDNMLYSFGVNDDNAIGRNGLESLPGLVSFKHKIIGICAGASYSAILTDKGHVYGCGTFKSTSGVFGFDPTKKFQENFERIQNLKQISNIFSGHNHLICLDKYGNIWTVGANEVGQLGRRHRERTIKRCLDASQISTKARHSNMNTFIVASGGGCHSIAINKEKECYGWGGNYNGQIGDGTTQESEVKRKVLLSNTTNVSCGTSHTVFLTENKELYGTGDNTLSQLGIKGDKMYISPILIMKDVDKARAGCDFTVAQKGNKLYSFGSNMNGELGFDEEEFDEIFVPTGIDFEFNEIVDFCCGSDFTLIQTK